MPGLMQRAKERTAEIILVYARGDAHIVMREPCAERVQRFVLPPALKDVAKARNCRRPGAGLPSVWDVLARAGFIGRRLLCRRRRGRHGWGAKCGVERALGRGRHGVAAA